jgi:hypothetical protein
MSAILIKTKTKNDNELFVSVQMSPMSPEKKWFETGL